jgi:[ribosomal protein S5]-alanine N-acetyltransferase
MQPHFTTSRLCLYELDFSETDFILELVNSPHWIKYIGNRNVNTKEEAAAFIQRIMHNPKIKYWVVKLRNQQTSMGIVTFIKRDYLDHSDIGFAFLDRFTKKGYAYEATVAVLHEVIKSPEHTHILATTIKENKNSIKLLEKLGFQFYREIKNENDLLLVYGAPIEKIQTH